VVHLRGWGGRQGLGKRDHPGPSRCGLAGAEAAGAACGLANRPHGRYRLSCPVRFTHRGDQWAAQATSGAVRYDISFDPNRPRWYLHASWTRPPVQPMTAQAAVAGGVVAVDLNAGHLDCFVVDRHGNPTGPPITIPLELAGLPASTRDGRLRAAITRVLDLAGPAGCGAIAVETLDFADARAAGRETLGRGRRGRRFRGTVAGIPTRRFRDRLVQMAANRGPCGGGRGCGVEVGVGWPLTVGSPASQVPEKDANSASRGQRGGGQTRAWPWGPAAARHARR
jgi:hypothetical protein